MESGSQEPTIVPFTPYEWQYVRELFRSRRLEDVKECLRILSTWISRTNDNTPVAIACSHVLLQAVHAELVAEGMHEWEQSMAIDDLRSKHGFAIVRFVNYINEMGQTGVTLKNMVHAVSKFGIEKKIVDIRHAITHQNCPDIGELRYATTVCLDWLWKNFWVSDARVALTSSNAGTAHLSNTDYEQRNREQQFDASLRAFKTWRHKNLSLSTELEWSQVSELHAIKNYILNDVTSFLTCFTKDQQLILTAHEWRQWKLPGTTSSAETWMVPEQIQSFWEPLFHLMLSMKLGAEIVISLLWRLKEQKISTTSSDQIRAYIRMMLTQFADADVFSPDEWVRILDHLLPVAKNFSRELIDIVMRNCPNLSRKRRNQVHQILTISNIRSSVSPPNMSADAASSSTSHNNTASTPTSSKSKNYHTMDDIQKLMRLRADKNEKPLPDTMTNPGTGIEKCESVDWMDVPFGMAPGQRIETFTVIVDIAEDGTCRKRKAFDTAITLE